ncbi:MAG: hypothetical protein FJ399_02880 [Verrucomicrobia bacterium]|nr:hypothetical protein [Verrucomicrobiota bacterium]
MNTFAGMWSEGKGASDDTGTRQYALLMGRLFAAGRTSARSRAGGSGRAGNGVTTEVARFAAGSRKGLYFAY